LIEANALPLSQTANHQPSLYLYLYCCCWWTEWCGSVAINGQWDHYEEWRANWNSGANWALRTAWRTLRTAIRYVASFTSAKQVMFTSRLVSLSVCLRAGVICGHIFVICLGRAALGV